MSQLESVCSQYIIIPLNMTCPTVGRNFKGLAINLTRRLKTVTVQVAEFKMLSYEVMHSLLEINLSGRDWTNFIGNRAYQINASKPGRLCALVRLHDEFVFGNLMKPGMLFFVVA